MLQLKVLIYEGTGEPLHKPLLRIMHVHTIKAFTIDRAPACPIMPHETAWPDTAICRLFVPDRIKSGYKNRKKKN